ncbi:MAG: L,D-transpeptidase family protein [Gammaproteobacteria bacterium]
MKIEDFVNPKQDKYIIIDAAAQKMFCYRQGDICNTYVVSTGKNGLGEEENSECTPRGWHAVYAVHGQHYPLNAVFVSRKWTGEIYSPALAEKNPGRDWIVTRVIQLDGLEPGRNRGGQVDSLKRYIYIHGTPNNSCLGVPGSKGCIRMANEDVISLAEWVSVGTRVCVQC